MFKTNDEAIRITVESLGLSDFEFSFKEEPEINGLRILSNGRQATVIFSQRAYLFRALGILAEHKAEQDFTHRETASFTMNGIMLDCSRNAVARLDTVKKMVRQLALMGHNTVMLYTEDTYEIEQQPYFGYFRGRYTVQELKQIDDYANMFGIEVIPCIQVLGHLHNVTKYTNTYGDITDLQGILLIDEERTYSFIEQMISTCRTAFRSKRIHIGMDETHFVGHGRYYDKHGMTDLQRLFLKHLDRVNEICSRYEFRPMIWGDMPLRLAGCDGYTDCDFKLENLSELCEIPDYVDFIYWDYYSKTPERFEEFIKVHKGISKNVIFSGGAWRWLNLAPNLLHSLKTSAMALEKCIENGIKEVFVTMWGDNGNEQSYFTSWPVIQLYAEYCFSRDFDEAYLEKRFKTCTGGILKDFYTLDRLNRPVGTPENIMAENPPKYLYYQDPMLGLYDYYVRDGYNAHYAACAEELKQCALRAGDFAYIFETTAALCDVLSDKAEIGVKITNAYKSGDKPQLEAISRDILPRIRKNVKVYAERFEKQWNTESKIFGFEVMDIRFGAMLRRLENAEKRLKAYITGELSSLPELEEARLPYDGHTENAVLSANWSGIVSASGI